MFQLDFSVEYDLDKICRSCLGESTEMNNIFTENIEDISLNEIISSCSQIQLNINDCLPNKICLNCTMEVSTAYQFKKKFEQSDYMLREYLSRNKMHSVMEEDMKQDSNSEHHLFEIKPEITFLEESDPLVNEKYFVSRMNVERADGMQENDNEIVEEDDDGISNDSRDSDDDDDDFKPNIKGEHSSKEEDDEEDDDEIEEEKTDNIFGDTSRHTIVPIESTYQKIDPADIAMHVEFKNGRHHCLLCKRHFVDKKVLNSHMKFHTRIGLKRCNVCDRAFIKNYHLTRHLKTHSRILKCKFCDERSFDSNAELRSHINHNHFLEATADRIKLNKKKCKAKTKENSKEKTAVTALVQTVPENDELEAICKLCENKFTRIYELRSHMKSHLDPKTLENVDFNMKQYLFEDGVVAENVIHFIVTQIYQGNSQRYYQVVNKNGEELGLSDSESENEDEKDSIFYEGFIKRDHVCSKCNISFDRMRKVIEHMREAHQIDDFSDFKCTHCSKCFPNPFLLERHLKSQCENTNKKIFCEVCKEKFMWQTSLNKHINVHHKPEIIVPYRPKKLHECRVCQKSFSRPEHLERHTKIHNPSEKKFECPECEKKFNRKDNLRSHMRIHTQDREENDKHLCVYCGRSFSNSSNLIVHMRRHTGEKPYKCDMCDKGFPRSSDLQCHRRTHTGEKPCLCTICGKGFSRSNKLVRHMRIHTGVRPYECTYCDRAFTQSNDLTLHIRRHTGEKPYVCGVCGDRFIQGTALKAHQRMQNHFDDNKTSPFASISVNNPNRFTNANRVNRIGDSNPNDPTLPAVKAVKPVKARSKVAKHIILDNNVKTEQQKSQTLLVVPVSITEAAVASSLTSTSTTDSSGPAGPSAPAVQRVFPNIGVPSGYIAANGVPYLSNSVLVQNFDLQTIFSIPQSQYNQ